MTKRKKKKEKVYSPPLRHLLLEGRTVIEWAGSYFMYPLIPQREEGYGRPVLIFPPFLLNDLSTTYIRKYLNDQNFEAYKWDMGVNFIRDSYLPKLEDKLREIYEAHEQKVSLVGWSAGGIFARVLANLYPEMVEQIVTIATPFRGIRKGGTNADLFFEMLNGKKKSEVDEEMLKLIEKTPKMPITCLYSTTDGIVPWQYCYEKKKRANIRNVEVFGSHGGLGANPAVLIYLAKILGQTKVSPNTTELPNGIAKVLYPRFWNLNKRKI